MDATSSAMVVLGAKSAVSCRQHLSYGVAWRQRKLLVCPAVKASARSQDPLQKGRFALVCGDRDRLLQCLQCSSVKLVLLDPDLGSADLCMWAELGQLSGKAVYLRVRSMPGLPERKKPISWSIKAFLDWLVALFLLALLSPILLFVTGWVISTGNGPILQRSIFQRQWCIGRRGRLFQILEFSPTPQTRRETNLKTVARSMNHYQSINSTMTHSSALWLKDSRLNNLLRLLNVVRGEMSLIGPHAWLLQDAGQISAGQQHCLNALPGLAGVEQLKDYSSLRDVAVLIDRNLNYMGKWSLVGDLRHLVSVIPKLWSGPETL